MSPIVARSKKERERIRAAVLAALDEPKPPTVRALAKKLGVDDRTIRRDLESVGRALPSQHVSQGAPPSSPGGESAAAKEAPGAEAASTPVAAAAAPAAPGAAPLAPEFHAPPAQASASTPAPAVGAEAPVPVTLSGIGSRS